MAARAQKAKAAPPEVSLQLMEDLGSFVHDPLGFVFYAWPWGEPGGPLEKEWPDDWQIENMEEIGARLRSDPYMPVLDAIAMGNGGGKSSELSWLIHWLMMTFPETRGTITAGTEGQLMTKLVPEVTKWRNMLIPGLRDMFTMEATSIYHPLFPKTWRCDFSPWSKANPDSVAGLHNSGKRLFVIGDEASAIADIIFDRLEGSLTDEGTEIFHILRGNPTKAEGKFKDCFTGPNRERWLKKQIDTRTCKKVNKRQVQEWLDQHGEDSDFFRIHVRGIFPRQSAQQFLSEELIQAARKREAVSFIGEPLVLSLDVAAQGGDRSILTGRRGLDARSFKAQRFPYDDSHGHLLQLAAKVAQACREHGAAAVFVDETGLGKGCVEELRRLRAPVIPIQYGANPLNCWPVEEVGKVRDRKAEIHAALKAWLHRGGAIEDSDELQIDCCAPRFYHNTAGEMHIEDKAALRSRGIASPDWLESLAGTFGAPVLDVPEHKAAATHPAGRVRGRNYDPLDEFDKRHRGG